MPEAMETERKETEEVEKTDLQESDCLICTMASPLIVCMTLEKLFNPSMPQFYHL